MVRRAAIVAKTTGAQPVIGDAAAALTAWPIAFRLDVAGDLQRVSFSIGEEMEERSHSATNKPPGRAERPSTSREMPFAVCCVMARLYNLRLSALG